MKYTQKSVSIFPNNVLLYNTMKYCILLSFHMTIKFLNVFQTSPFCPYRVPDIATWSYQTRGFVCSSHRDTYFHFTISHWLLSLLSVLSVCHISINHLLWKLVAFYPAQNCKELPSSWSGVTFFPVKTLNCHISRTRHTGIPVFALNWDLVTPILYIKHRANSSKGTLGIWPLFVPFDPAAAARGRR